MQDKAEFFKAFYWIFEGRFVRLTSYNERDCDEVALTKVAFERARVYGLVPLYMRIFTGQFLRHGDDNGIGVVRYPRETDNVC